MTLALTFLILSHPAHADFATELGINPDQKVTVGIADSDFVTPTLVDPVTNEEIQNNLKIFGKGFQDRKTKEIIVLACVGNRIQGTSERDCNLLQHVYFAGPHAQPVLVGSPIVVAAEGAVVTQKEYKTTLRNLAKNYRRWDKADRRNRSKKLTPQERLNQHAVLYGGLADAAIVGSILLIVPVSDAIVFPVAVIAACGIAFGLPQFSVQLSFPHRHMISYLYDQNGWNWSEHVKRIKHRTFHSYSGFIQ